MSDYHSSVGKRGKAILNAARILKELADFRLLSVDCKGAVSLFS
jgi:hypothetical protein